MENKQRVPEDRDPLKKNEDQKLKKESKFLSGLKKVGFKVWLAVMIIGGALAFLTALFLV